MKIHHQYVSPGTGTLRILVASAMMAVAAVAAVTASAAPSATKFTFGTQGSNFLIDVAEDQGLFEKQGIDVEIVNFASPAAEYAALNGGQIDAALTPPNILLAQNAGRTSGNHYVYFENWARTDLSIIGGPKANLPSTQNVGFVAAMQALKGKTFGVPAFGGIADVIPRQMMKAAGLDPDKDVKFVAVAYGQTARTALQTGTIDAYPFDATFAAPAVADDGGTLIVNASDPKVPANLRLGSMMYAGYAGVEGTIKERLATYRAVDRALLRAKAFLADSRNLPKVRSLAEKNFNMSPKAAAAFASLGVPLQTAVIGCAPLGVALTNFVKWGVAKPPIPTCADLMLRVLKVSEVNKILPPPAKPKK